VNTVGMLPSQMAQAIFDLEQRVQELLELNSRLHQERQDLDWTAMVRAFFHVARQHQPVSPERPTDAVLRLRLRLMIEELFEVLETCAASDRSVRVLLSLRSIMLDWLEREPLDFHMRRFTHEVLDLLYVGVGALVAVGVDPRPLMGLLQKANIEKKGGPIRESDGKQLKPEGWQPADIGAGLREQGWRHEEA